MGIGNARFISLFRDITALVAAGEVAGLIVRLTRRPAAASQRDI